MAASTASVALVLLEAGFSVIPIRVDGSKAPPERFGWNPYRERRMVVEEAERTWSHELGVAIICGRVSGGLEVLDFDDPDTFEKWKAMAVDDGILPSVPIIRTPNGWHVYLKRSAPSRSQKLARTMDDEGKAKDTLVEIKGEGGYVVAPGSPKACHETGRRWRHFEGPKLSEWQQVELVDDATYLALVALARSMNQHPGTLKLTVGAPLMSGMSGEKGTRPGDAYNVRATWAEILEPHGWCLVRSSPDRAYWRRPGKDKGGTSATTGFCSNGETDLLYVFSTNAGALESDRAYDRFGAFARLSHGGDLAAAAQDLASKGYGEAAVIDPRELDTELAALEERAKEAGHQEVLDHVRAARKKLAPTVDSTPESLQDGREAALSELRRFTGLPIARVVQTRLEGADFLIVTDDEEIVLIGTAEKLLTSRYFEQRIFERIHLLLAPKVKTKAGWGRVCRLFSRVVEVEDLLFRQPEQTLEWVRDLVRETTLFRAEGEERWQKALLHKLPFEREDRIWINSAKLQTWLLTQSGLRIDEKEIWRRLRAAGFERKTVKGRPDQSGKPIGRSYWGLARDVLWPPE